mmetsp:Transcript_26756/g.85843  ORF Transcript_26756/g.85843 Transcript_26756/m.85843 type:complete len:357 (-) Transcript_26756:622-1692(-)
MVCHQRQQPVVRRLDAREHAQERAALEVQPPVEVVWRQRPRELLARADAAHHLQWHDEVAVRDAAQPAVGQGGAEGRRAEHDVVERGLQQQRVERPLHLVVDAQMRDAGRGAAARSRRLVAAEVDQGPGARGVRLLLDARKPAARRGRDQRAARARRGAQLHQRRRTAGAGHAQGGRAQRRAAHGGAVRPSELHDLGKGPHDRRVEVGDTGGARLRALGREPQVPRGRREVNPPGQDARPQDSERGAVRGRLPAVEDQRDCCDLPPSRVCKAAAVVLQRARPAHKEEGPLAPLPRLVAGAVAEGDGAGPDGLKQELRPALRGEHQDGALAVAAPGTCAWAQGVVSACLARVDGLKG